MDYDDFLESSDSEPEVNEYSETAEEIPEQDARLFLSTPFDEYTVTEGLLLLLLLFALISALVRVVREAFSWV